MSRTGGATSSKPVQSRGDVIRETYSRRRRRHRSAGRRVGARRAAGGLVGANHSGGVAVARRPWCVSKEHHEEFVNTPPDADSSTALALERTRLAHERTLMAWVRTATSLISFGFTIYKAFEYLRQRQPDVPRLCRAPRPSETVEAAASGSSTHGGRGTTRHAEGGTGGSPAAGGD